MELVDQMPIRPFLPDGHCPHRGTTIPSRECIPCLQQRIKLLSIYLAHNLDRAQQELRPLQLHDLRADVQSWYKAMGRYKGGK